MRPKIILHVGTEKTGSTSIQNMLNDSYDVFLKSGILFPKSIGIPCNIKLTACALEDEPNHPIRDFLGLKEDDVFSRYVQETKTALFEEIKQTSPSVIIISDEHISAHLSNTNSLLKYKKICEKYGDIDSLIIYLRQQDEFRLSMLSEAIRSGNLSGFDLKNILPIFSSIPYELNYVSVLDNLSEVFGRETIKPVIYNREEFPNYDIRDSFLNVASINVEYKKTSNQNQNKSIDARIISHLAEISSACSKINQPWSKVIRNEIIQSCEKIFTGSGPVLQKKAHKIFLDQFENHNNILHAKYFHNDKYKDNLFPNHYLKDRLTRPIYPECTIPWPEFFIKFAKLLLFKDFYVGADDELTASEADPKCDERRKLKMRNQHGMLDASCPVCGRNYSLDILNYSREGRLCSNCGASGRASAIAYCISKILLGKQVALPHHAVDRTKRIIGLSDGLVYSNILREKYKYENTFFHREPFLDIANPSADYLNTADVLIASEVFEHVVGPSISAFRGAFNVIKPGGYMILTVPFVNVGESLEHYGENLQNYNSYKRDDDGWVVELEFKDGRKEIDFSPRFHGGPGKTLEIRLFNRQRLLDELYCVGFEEVCVYDSNIPEYGINWEAASRVITARKPIF